MTKISSCLVIVFALFVALFASPPARPVEPPTTLCGTVLGADGAPFSGEAHADLRAEPAAEPAARTVVDEAGRYCLETDGLSNPIVTVGSEKFVTVRRALPAEEGMDLPPATLLPDAAVELEVRRADGGPAAGAAVRVESASPDLWRHDWRPLERTSTAGDDGRLTVPRAPGEGLEVFAAGAAEDQAPDSIHLVVVLPGATDDAPPTVLTAPLAPADGTAAPASGLHALLPPGRPVYGRVLDERRRPLPDAEVVLRATGPGSNTADAAAVAASTGPDGRFLLPAAPGPRFDLTADAPGYAPSELPGMTLFPGWGAADLGTLELQPGATIEGRVTSVSGEPLEGAEIRYREVTGLPNRQQREALRREPPATTSGPDGAFALTDLPAGRALHLLTSRDGYLTTWTLGVETPPEQPVEIALERAGAVAGTLVSEEGEPLAGGTVLLAFPGPPPGTVGVERRRGDGSRRATTDDDGAFRFEELDPGAVRLSAEVEGYRPVEPREVEVGPGEERTGVTLVAERGAVIRGTAFGPDGEPLADAQMRARDARVVTGSDGGFELSGLETGFVGLFGYHPDYKPAVVEVDVQPGVNEADLYFEEGFEISGRTVDRAGDPLSGVRVVVRLEGPRQRAGHVATSGADGAFRVVVGEEGSHRLVATRDGYAPAIREGLPAGPAPVQGLEVVLERGAAIVGQIYGLEVDDLATVEVEARSERFGTVSGGVDYLGQYAVRNLVPGDWQVRAQVAGGRRAARATVVVNEGDTEVTRDLEMGAGIAFSGQVRHRGEPVSGAHVSLDGRDVPGNRSVVSGHDGGFRIEDLEPGRYRLDVLDPSRALSHLEEISLDSDRRVVLDLVSERLTGRVVDAESGEPIHEALVYVRGTAVGGGGSAEADGSLTVLGTDTAGGFVVAHVSPGTYSVSARKDGYAPEETTVRVAAGREPPAVELRLAGAGGLHVNLRVASGEPPSFVTVTAFDGSGNPVHTDTETATDTGISYFEQFPPGSWNLLVSGQGFAAEWVTGTVPGVIEVPLAPAGPLAVRVPALIESGGAGSVIVVGGDGRPFFQVEPGGAVRNQWRLEDGLATVPDLPAGQWTVQVTTATGETWTGAVTTDGRAPAEATLR